MDFGLTFVSDETLVVSVAFLMVVALSGALIVSKRRTGSWLTPVTLFFAYAVVHAIFGRIAATILATKYTFVGPATLETFANQAFLIISTGLISCLLAYICITPGSRGRMPRTLIRMTDPKAFEGLCRRSRVLVLIAIPLIIFGLQQLGGIPLFSDNLRFERYLMNFTSEHRFDTFVVNRGREIIVFPVAALTLGWFLSKRRLVDLAFIAVAVVSCLLTATRSPILIGLSIVTVVLLWASRVKIVLLISLLLLFGLMASEVVLGNESGTGTKEWTAVERLAADVSEVRDLAWTLAKHGEPYWGATFVAGLLPIPAFASDFTQTYHLRTITLQAIGIPLTAGHGGLRVTYSGEWFLNFGWPGVFLGGFLYGWMCSWFSFIFHRLKTTSLTYPVGAFALACAWVAMSFMIYISSSGAGGTLKTYAAGLLILTFRLPRTVPTGTRVAAPFTGLRSRAIVL